MKKILLASGVGASMLAGLQTASAQYYDPNYYGPRPNYREYREYDGPPRYYRRYGGGEIVVRRDPRNGQLYCSRRGTTASVPGWSVQDGVCKPYTGR
jgi:hypothetical protein